MLKDKATFRREKDRYMSETKIEIIRAKRDVAKK